MIGRMNHVKVTEGLIPFEYPTLPKRCSTWYKIYGDLNSPSVRPLVVLHGGPGCTHNYMLSLVDLAEDRGIPVIFYDQVGCGNSTHIREKRLDEAFWTTDLFIAELDNLLSHLGISENFDLLGQSWGGVLASSFAIRGHAGLNRLIISNSPASLDLWVTACNNGRKELPKEVDEILEIHEKARDFDNQEYKDACLVWMKRYMCRIDPWPEYVVRSFELMDEDDTVYFTMNGPSEFTVIGSLRDFDLTGRLKHISVPTMVLNGEFDSADSNGISPFLKEIANVKQYTFPGCSHMCHVEERDRYMEVVTKFLA